MKKVFYIFSIVIVAAILLPWSVNAQDAAPKKKVKTDSIPLQGLIYDRLTSRELPSTLVQVLRPDSSLISTAKGGYTYWNAKNGAVFKDSTSRYEIYLPRVKGDYIIKVTKEGYTDLYAPYTAEFGSRTSELKAPKLYLSREMVKELEEVTVKASKIKLYHKGDTLVYNADAFSLPEGSMLDALVQQMPGVEIKGNKIYVNGRFVESLLLNGKEFFKGDQSVAMQNIGAYAVKNVAVYEKNEESAELLGDRDDVEKELVMDVRLKKDYMTGTAVNADAGYGTRGRYLGRLFALGYTNNSRFSLYGNTNNMNISNRLDENGEQYSYKSDNGITTRANAGIDYSLDNAMHTWELTGNADVHYTDEKDEQTINAQQYLQGADNFNFKNTKSRLYNLKVSTDHKLSLNQESWNFRLNPSFNYNRQKSHSDTYAATFDKEFDGMSREILDNLYSQRFTNYTSALINRNLEFYDSNQHGYEGELAMASKIKIPNSPDAVELKGNIRYNRNTMWGTTLQDICFGVDQLNPLSPASSLLQRREETIRPDYTLRLLGLARYYFTLPKGSLNVSYEYIHTQTRKNSGLMMLEAQAQGTMAEFLPGDIPMPDMANSYASKFYKNQHHLKVIWRLKKKYERGTMELSAEPSIYLERHDLFYNQGDAFVNPEKTFLRFKVENTNFRWSNPSNTLRLMLAYYLNQEAPNLLKMVDIRNTSDPMNIWLGNPNLKQSLNQTIYGNIYYKQGKHTVHQGYFNANFSNNAFANGYRYNSATGIREMKTYNVNGVNNANFGYYFSQDLDKSEEWQFRNGLSGNISNYANMIGYDADPTPQKVRSFGFYDYMSFSMEKKNVTVRLSGNYTLTRSISQDPNPMRSTFGNRGGSLFAEVKLPLNFSISSSINVVNYYGYIDDNMNRTDYYWNAQLYYTMLKGALSFSVKANDILNQDRGFNIYADASGRTQTENLILGRVILFTVGYKFQIKPKRR